MNREHQRLANYLEHILEAICRIQRYTGNLDQASFLENQLVQDAVIRNLEIIGEASNNIQKYCPEFAAWLNDSGVSRHQKNPVSGQDRRNHSRTSRRLSLRPAAVEGYLR